MAAHEPLGPDDVEVTPEMIEAGLLELARFDARFQEERDAVRKIFRAMLKALNQKLG
jgi:hypothetical protein